MRYHRAHSTLLNVAMRGLPEDLPVGWNERWIRALKEYNKALLEAYEDANEEIRMPEHAVAEFLEDLI